MRIGQMHPQNRITYDPQVMGGKPCIRGLRVTVGTVVGLVASGHSAEQIVAAYPYLEAEDVRAALEYAAWRMEQGIMKQAACAEERDGGIAMTPVATEKTKITRKLKAAPERAKDMVALDEQHWDKQFADSLDVLEDLSDEITADEKPVSSASQRSRRMN